MTFWVFGYFPSVNPPPHWSTDIITGSKTSSLLPSHHHWFQDIITGSQTSMPGLKASSVFHRHQCLVSRHHQCLVSRHHQCRVSRHHHHCSTDINAWSQGIISVPQKPMPGLKASSMPGLKASSVPGLKASSMPGLKASSMPGPKRS